MPSATTDRPPFGLDWLARYLPHYLTCAPSQLHLDLAADLRDFHLTRGRRLNRLAPRGSGKTVWGNTGYSAWCALEGIEPYTLVLSETATQANAFLRDVRAELEGNPAILRDYPHAAGRGPVWRDDVIRLNNGCMIQARGVGGSIRGLKNRSERPSLVIVDDPNEDEDAYSPTRRQHKLDWFNKAVLNVGSPRTNVLVLGTPIHREAIVYALAKGEQAAAWETRSYRSVIRWPDRADLWDGWRRLVMNYANPDRLAAARAFYDANRDEMDAGSEVLWPDREPIYDLMLHRVTVGESAFNCEKQDQPGTDGATEWPPELFDHPALWFDDWPDGIVFKVQSLDPSKGSGEHSKSKPGDDQAHVLLGLHRSGDWYFDCELHREPAYARRAAELAARWRPDVFVFEVNGTMGLLTAELRELLEKYAPYLLDDGRAKAKTQTHPKLARMRLVGPHLEARRVRVRRTPGGRALVDQWRDVPNGAKDDAADAAGTAAFELMVRLGLATERR